MFHLFTSSSSFITSSYFSSSFLYYHHHSSVISHRSSSISFIENRHLSQVFASHHDLTTGRGTTSLLLSSTNPEGDIRTNISHTRINFTNYQPRNSFIKLIMTTQEKKPLFRKVSKLVTSSWFDMHSLLEFPDHAVCTLRFEGAVPIFSFAYLGCWFCLCSFTISFCWLVVVLRASAHIVWKIVPSQWHTVQWSKWELAS